jgi:hypothetical protein
MTNVERAVKNLKDNLIVISALEKRQSELLKIHSQRLVLLESESAEYRRRTDKSLAHIATNLEEMTDKLNGLIATSRASGPRRLRNRISVNVSSGDFATLRYIIKHG